MEDCFLIFSHMPEMAYDENDRVVELKKKYNKRMRHASLAFKDGFIFDYREQGLIMGETVIPKKYDYWLPVVEMDHRLTYSVIKAMADKDNCIDKSRIFYSHDGESLRDLEHILEAIKNNRSPHSDFADRNKITGDTYLAYLLGASDYYTYDTDKLWEVYGELGRPGKISDYKWKRT